MMGFIATTNPLDPPDEASLDPKTWAHPSPALLEMQAQATAAMEDPEREGPLAAIVAVPPGTWVAACPDCFRRTGLLHDCTARNGAAVTLLYAVLVPEDTARS